MKYNTEKKRKEIHERKRISEHYYAINVNAHLTKVPSSAY